MLAYEYISSSNACSTLSRIRIHQVLEKMFHQLFASILENEEVGVIENLYA